MNKLLIHKELVLANGIADYKKACDLLAKAATSPAAKHITFLLSSGKEYDNYALTGYAKKLKKEFIKNPDDFVIEYESPTEEQKNIIFPVGLDKDDLDSYLVGHRLSYNKHWIDWNGVKCSAPALKAGVINLAQDIEVIKNISFAEAGNIMDEISKKRNACFHVSYYIEGNPHKQYGVYGRIREFHDAFLKNPDNFLIEYEL